MHRITTHESGLEGGNLLLQSIHLGSSGVEANMSILSVNHDRSQRKRAELTDTAISHADHDALCRLEPIKLVQQFKYSLLNFGVTHNVVLSKPFCEVS
jgi:hypothetical protein